MRRALIAAAVAALATLSASAGDLHTTTLTVALGDGLSLVATDEGEACVVRGEAPEACGAATVTFAEDLSSGSIKGTFADWTFDLVLDTAGQPRPITGGTTDLETAFCGEPTTGLDITPGGIGAGHVTEGGIARTGTATGGATAPDGRGRALALGAAEIDRSTSVSTFTYVKGIC